MSVHRAAMGRKLASKDVVDSHTIRGWQALPLVHFPVPRLQVAASLARAGNEPAGERFQLYPGKAYCSFSKLACSCWVCRF